MCQRRVAHRQSDEIRLAKMKRLEGKSNVFFFFLQSVLLRGRHSNGKYLLWLSRHRSTLIKNGRDLNHQLGERKLSCLVAICSPLGAILSSTRNLLPPSLSLSLSLSLFCFCSLPQFAASSKLGFGNDNHMTVRNYPTERFLPPTCFSLRSSPLSPSTWFIILLWPAPISYFFFVLLLQNGESRKRKKRPDVLYHVNFIPKRQQ